MKKRKKGRKLARKRDQRRALKKSLAVALISRERIKTTLAKAKELRPEIEKMISRAKKQDVTAIRYLLRYLPKKSAQKLIKIAPQFKESPGGYTRIIKLDRQKTNAAPRALIELILSAKDQHPPKTAEHHEKPAS